jgi:regulator of cell morphogenesis and NO signaling
MLREHDTVGDLLRQLRQLTDGYQPPADACGSYEALFAGLEALEADTHLHIHKENNLLFPAVEQLEQRLSS